MTTNVLNTKISKDVDKILKTSNLRNTNNLNTKVNEIENKILIMINMPLLLLNLMS